MKMFKSAGAILILIGFLGACKAKLVQPEGRLIQTEVTGTVISDVDGSPVDSIKVMITGRRGSVMTSFKDTLLVEVYTNNKGVFNINQKFPSGYSFSAMAYYLGQYKAYSMIGCNYNASPCPIELGKTNTFLFVVKKVR